jgi:hypothetical protein
VGHLECGHLEQRAHGGGIMNDHLRGWSVLVDVASGLRHVMPTDEHHTKTDCKCSPKPDIDDDTIVIHNSFDGRDSFERGERKPS